ncbi:hypothetical protein ACIOJE_27730 [Kitasatospora sp. NPDC087861]|uniref:hypothetical protein n=1 Tax=Kitasatospora sp. NPDC087861 TaxID=3364070 RepID=UPI0038022ED6
MSARPWPARLSSPAAKVLATLPTHVQEMVRDILDIASRAPWGWPQWDAADPDGAHVRSAAIGQFTMVYLVNSAVERIVVIDVVWLS